MPSHWGRTVASVLLSAFVTVGLGVPPTFAHDGDGVDHVHAPAIPAYDTADLAGPGQGCPGIVGLTPAPHLILPANTPLLVGGRYHCDLPNPEVTLAINDEPIALTWGEGGVVQAHLDGLAPGIHQAVLRDGQGRERRWELVVSQVGTSRLFGSTRALTATAVADHLLSEWGEDWAANPRVIVINGERIADAMAATTLAHYQQAPILIATQDQVPQETIAWLQAHPKAEVTLVGGEAVLSRAVEDQLAPHVGTITRLGGETRYATGVNVAEHLLQTTEFTRVVVADAGRWQDALPAAVYAARTDGLWLMSDADRLAEPVRQFLSSHPDLVKDLTVAGATLAPTLLDQLSPTQPITRIEPTLMTPLNPVSTEAMGDGNGALGTTLAGLGTKARTNILVMASAENPVDAITAGPLAARHDGLLLADRFGAAALTPGVQHQKGLATKELMVIGGPKAIGEAQVHTLLGIGVDIAVPTVENLTIPEGSIGAGRVTLRANQPIANAVVVVQDANGIAVDGVTTIDGSSLSWVPAGYPTVTNPVTVSAIVVHEQAVRHIAFTGDLLIPRSDRHGWTVAPGVGPVIGERGTLFTWAALVEPGTGWAIEDWNRLAESVLNDGRGWTHDGKVRLQRIDDPERASIRLVLAKPKTVDAQCLLAGLHTGGRLSCWNGRNAMVNLDRVNHGVTTFPDLDTYRTYVISHEFGHGLGHGHVTTPCRDPKQLAPVMMQQSKHLLGCTPNGWPFPHALNQTP